MDHNAGFGNSPWYWELAAVLTVLYFVALGLIRLGRWIYRRLFGIRTPHLLGEGAPVVRKHGKF